MKIPEALQRMGYPMEEQTAREDIANACVILDGHSSDFNLSTVLADIDRARQLLRRALTKMAR